MTELNIGHRFDPWSRKTPHAAEQLSPCTQQLNLSSRAHEPQLLKLVQLESVFYNVRSYHNEKLTQCNKE